jgi:hypothetical protein
MIVTHSLSDIDSLSLELSPRGLFRAFLVFQQFFVDQG